MDVRDATAAESVTERLRSLRGRSAFYRDLLVDAGIAQNWVARTWDDLRRCRW